MWILADDFMDVVTTSWLSSLDFSLPCNLRALKTTLSQWDSCSFGNLLKSKGDLLDKITKLHADGIDNSFIQMLEHNLMSILKGKELFLASTLAIAMD